MAESQLEGHNFVLILYPDATNYNFESTLQSCQEYADQWAWCLHDRFSMTELEEEPEKKPHVHFFLHFNSSKLLSTLTTRIFPDLSFQHYIQFAKDKKGSIQYLVHANSPEKYQFAVTDIHSNFDVRDFFSKHFECKEFDQILSYIDSHPTLTLRQLVTWVSKNGYVQTFRRNYFVLRDYFHPTF